MIARLAGGVNLNHIRFHSREHHQTTAGDGLIYLFVNILVNGIEQRGFEGPFKENGCSPLFSCHTIPAAHLRSILHSPSGGCAYILNPVTIYPQVPLMAISSRYMQTQKGIKRRFKKKYTYQRIDSKDIQEKTN
jgi:hypothetical protein